MLLHVTAAFFVIIFTIDMSDTDKELFYGLIYASMGTFTGIVASLLGGLRRDQRRKEDDMEKVYVLLASQEEMEARKSKEDMV